MFQSTHPHGVRHPARAYAMVDDYVSIHAPTRGATLVTSLSLHSFCCFNPRTHTGCDMSMAAVVWDRNGVSIHAPTRGATVGITWHSVSDGVSIHAPTRGATGTWHVWAHSSASFNPRTHTGCDANCPYFISFDKKVSIHAPTRGATTCSY